MLKTLDGADFATGRARFLDEDANALEGTAKIFVKIEPSNLGSPVLAQLDLGGHPKPANEGHLKTGQR
jgi:hypothetical protein